MYVIKCLHILGFVLYLNENINKELINIMNKFKKIVVTMVAAVMVLTLTGCTTTTTTITAVEVSDETPVVSMEDYTNDFDGIVNYMKDMELIAGDGSEMSADYIGAIAGEKFTYTYKDATMTCEIYEFDQENISDTATATIASAKEDGTITVIGTEIAATISDNEKFLMIFVNSSEEDTFTDYNDNIVELFKAFSGTEVVAE